MTDEEYKAAKAAEEAEFEAKIQAIVAEMIAVGFTNQQIEPLTKLICALCRKVSPPKLFGLF